MNGKSLHDVSESKAWVLLAECEEVKSLSVAHEVWHMQFPRTPLSGWSVHPPSFRTLHFRDSVDLNRIHFSHP